MVRINSGDNRLTVSLRSAKEKDFSVTIFTVQAVLDPHAVAANPKSKGQTGTRGFATTTWRVTKRMGVEQKELLSEDTYPPPSRIMAGGE